MEESYKYNAKSEISLTKTSCCIIIFLYRSKIVKTSNCFRNLERVLTGEDFPMGQQLKGDEGVSEGISNVPNLDNNT